MTLNPYEIYGGVLGTNDPVILNISGGRTSGYLLRKVLDAYGGTLPEHVHAVFTNTGREFDQTLDFLQEMGRQWNAPITWLERDFTEGGPGFNVVSHNSASRNGEPFEALIEKRKYLPNGVARFCTIELKIRATTKWMKSLGYKKWASIVGFRADEAHRLLRAHKRDAQKKDPWYTLAPMVDAGVTRRDVSAFWKQQPFNLRLPDNNGKTPLGNCDLCFLKSQAILAGIARDFPERMAWWTGIEARAEELGATSGATFRPPVKSSHTMIADTVARQGTLPMVLDDDGIDCFCTD
jgi:3'-phosphoadenosine 5'-phosphosulfate sulfotransferase (PAPS reductase)/FAD synthetase